MPSPATRVGTTLIIGGLVIMSASVPAPTASYHGKMGGFCGPNGRAAPADYLALITNGSMPAHTRGKTLGQQERVVEYRDECVAAEIGLTRRSLHPQRTGLPLQQLERAAEAGPVLEVG